MLGQERHGSVVRGPRRTRCVTPTPAAATSLPSSMYPSPEFLADTMPLLILNPGLALMQACWEFSTFNSCPIAYASLEGSLLIVHAPAITVCSEHKRVECLLMRTQEMSMDYHFKVEQQAGSSLCYFFGYNWSLTCAC